MTTVRIIISFRRLITAEIKDFLKFYIWTDCLWAQMVTVKSLVGGKDQLTVNCFGL